MAYDQSSVWRQLCCAGTELEDVKRLLRGTPSTSSTQSHTNTLPIPTKASVETRSMSESSSTGSTSQLSCLLPLRLLVKFILVWSARSFSSFCLPYQTTAAAFGLEVWAAATVTAPTPTTCALPPPSTSQVSNLLSEEIIPDVQQMHLTFFN